MPRNKTGSKIIVLWCSSNGFGGVRRLSSGESERANAKKPAYFSSALHLTLISCRRGPIFAKFPQIK